MNFRLNLTIATLLLFNFSFAQNNSVYLQQSYSNQSFYHLVYGETANVDNNSWDLAFSTGTFNSSIRTNDGKAVELYTYYLTDTSGWSTINNLSINSLPSPQFNSDTGWSVGAFDVYSSAFPDYGWGIYNMLTHNVVGDSLHIIKTTDGIWKKLWIEKLDAGVYFFKHANLDGTNLITQQVNTNNYSNKKFVYYDIDSDQTLDREPADDQWHFTFTKYITPVMNQPYSVTGVLCNEGIQVAKALQISSPSSYTNFVNHNFEYEINEIGYDWKTFDMGSFSYIIDNSRCYFIKDFDNNIFRIYFTEFEGSSTGKISFNVTQMNSSVSINDKSKSTINVYPNPASDNVNIVTNTLDLNSQINIYDISGKLIFSQKIKDNFSVINLPVDTYKSGVYTISLLENKSIYHKKLIVK